MRELRVADIAAPFPVDRGRGGRKRASSAGNLLFLYGAVLLGVLPAAYLVFSSFNIAPLGAPAAYGLDAWKAAFADPRIVRSIITSFVLSLRTFFAFGIALFIS